MHYKGGGFNYGKERGHVVVLDCIKGCAMGLRLNARPQILRKLARAMTVSMTRIMAPIEKSKESRSERPVPGQSNQSRRLFAASGGNICAKNESQSSLT